MIRGFDPLTQIPRGTPYGFRKGKILHPIENISRDLAIIGDGSLTIEIPNATGDAVGLSAAALIVGADLTVKTPDCENSSVGIVCSF